jgi:hypothetical protein
MEPGMRRSLRLSLALAIALLPTAAHGQDKLVWFEFAPKDVGFQVQLPSDPTELRQMPELADGAKLDLRIWSASAGQDAGCLVGYVAYPEALLAKVTTEEERDNLVETAQKSALANVKGKVASTKKIKLGTHPGREVAITGDQPGHGARARLYLIDKKLYIQLVVGANRFVESPDALKFLDSFKLTAEKKP